MDRIFPRIPVVPDLLIGAIYPPWVVERAPGSSKFLYVVPLNVNPVATESSEVLRRSPHRVLSPVLKSQINEQPAPDSPQYRKRYARFSPDAAFPSSHELPMKTHKPSADKI